MKVAKVTVSAPPHEKTMKTCNTCSETVKIHITCFKCNSIYHPECLLEASSVYVNKTGQIFCCQKLTSKYKSFEKKSETQENKNGKCKEESACSSDGGLEDSKLGQDKYGKDDICYQQSKEEEISEEVDIDRDDFVCYFCKDKVKFYEEESYKEHIKLCEKNPLRLNKTQDADEKCKKVFKCDKCSYQAKWQYELKRHSNVHSLEKQFKCTFKSCNCSQSLDTSQVKPCDCSMCEYRTASKRYLRQHILQNHSNKGKQHKCNDCPYSTSVKTRLIQHKYTHIGKRQFKCHICEFEATYKCNLSRHILLRHSNVEKRYKCNNCKFSTHEKEHLKKHMRTHSTEKQFKCDKCEYTAASKSQLKVHMARTHNFVSTIFKCDKCEFETVYKASFGTHKLLIHGNIEKQYKCHECKFSTHRKSTLTRHMKTHSSADD